MNSNILVVIVLSIVWVFITGEPSLTNWLVGFAAAAVFLTITGGTRGRGSFRRLPARTALLAYLCFILVPLHVIKANFHLARRILRANPDMQDDIVQLPEGDVKGAAAGLEELIITVTPGQVVVDYSEGDERVSVHLVGAVQDEDEMRSNVLWMHRMVKEVFA